MRYMKYIKILQGIPNHNKKKRRKAFTLVEILLSVGLLLLLSGISLPVFQGMILKNDLETATNYTVKALHIAQLNSQAVKTDHNWGIKLQSGLVTIFNGATYASRDTTYDQTYDLSSNISLAGLNEIVFSKLTGEPIQFGNINISTNYNDSKTISINSKGIINY